MNNMQSRAKVFEFVSYGFSADKRRVFFDYKTTFDNDEEISFRETIILLKMPDLNKVPKELLKKLLEGLHIMLGISYHKFYCATNLKLPHELSEKEAEFWNIVYKKGLGEFFYKNNLNPKDSPQFPYKKNFRVFPCLPRANPRGKVPRNSAMPTKILVGMGGGKDSIVATELLRRGKFETTAFLVKRKSVSDLTEKVVAKTGLNVLKIERILDEKVSQKHLYDGHIPISAIYAFLGILAAVLYDYRYVIVGNEHSSDFGNLKYKGLEINHQWSKSFEFESLFQNYVKEFITPDVFYFSLLRPFYEIRIAEMFSENNPSTSPGTRKYFPVFSSCNQNFKMKFSRLPVGRQGTMRRLWCEECPKCVFVFIMLSAFLSKKDLFRIFRKNLYEDKNLLPLFKDILGLPPTNFELKLKRAGQNFEHHLKLVGGKPFDCVGTFEEAQTALFLAKKHFSGSFIMRQLGGKAKYHKEVFLTGKENNIPEQFKFLGMKNILILGYGMEGIATKKYIEKYYPHLRIGIGDMKKDKNYLKKQDNFDIAVKTPGINKNLVKIPYTTATNIFFSKNKGKNLIIGVTGSKGKSTTASLIYEIIKTADKPVELLGNIGKPMLERLLKPIKGGTIFVLELSSFQLDDIRFSPDIAIGTNLFPEHMDYHGNVENYYFAKKNIINFQNENNFFVYNPENKIMAEWLKNYRGKAIPFAKDIPVNDNDIPLLGEHNKDNIKATAATAKILGISDKIISKAVKNFKGLPHRLEFVGEYGGIRFYDDAISTTPESTIMAIKSIPNVGVIFLGGEDRGYDFSLLEKTIKKHKIRNVALFSESGNKILKSRKGFNILETSDMEKAVKFAFENAEKGSACLLSCASPSYSLWKNFEEKGNEFKKFVKRLDLLLNKISKRNVEILSEKSENRGGLHKV